MYCLYDKHRNWADLSSTRHGKKQLLSLHVVPSCLFELLGGKSYWLLCHPAEQLILSHCVFWCVLGRKLWKNSERLLALL